MSTIAIVIPSLNDAEFLERCLRAIALQTRAPDEIIVVDNGSTDTTAEVARAGGARVVDEPRRGIWPASSAGFDAATSDYLARLDADSLPAQGWLAELERRMDAEDSPTVVTDSGVFYGNGPIVRWLGTNVYLGGYFWFCGLLLGHPPVFGSNFGLRRDAWLELRDVVHRDRADLHDDLDLAWMLRPGMDVVRDRDLVVGISARPFDTWPGFLRRVRMAFHTLAVLQRAWPLHRRARERRGAAPWRASGR
ncbi:glycosyltransferase family 2 protein [Agromyces seonyuensis]|uniref:4,4'-diaponeurosporenoate glycosyltransferase n=1 Tax=Agromyces seonyuensis TaxID=2662446 RepID=A0A6I4NZW2_9MICO|nr:glycosyltransferase family 2 protein [Agromyces seonyuensis]MWB98005.1 glycosyltransferase [Agromyces seonyuensis]